MRLEPARPFYLTTRRAALSSLHAERKSPLAERCLLGAPELGSGGYFSHHSLQPDGYWPLSIGTVSTGPF